MEGPWTGGTQGTVERLSLILKREELNDHKYGCWGLPSMPGPSSCTQLPEPRQPDLYLPGRRQKEASLGNWSKKKNVNILTLRTSQQGSPTQINPTAKSVLPVSIYRPHSESQGWATHQRKVPTWKIETKTSKTGTTKPGGNTLCKALKKKKSFKRET